MNCPRCGSSLAPRSVVCGVCWTPVPEGPEAPFKVPPLLAALAVVQIVGGAVGIYLFVVFPAIRWLAGGGLVPVNVPAALAKVLIIVGSAFSVLQLVCAVGLLRFRPWGRGVQLVLAWIGLLAFPFGTVVSALLLIYLHKPGIVALYSGKTRAGMNAGELAEVAAVTRGSSAATAGLVAAAFVAVGAAVVLLVAALTVAQFVPTEAPGAESSATSEPLDPPRAGASEGVEPEGRSAWMRSNAASAVGTLRSINLAQAAYAARCGGGAFAVTLEDLAKPLGGGGPGFVSGDLHTNGVTKQGYRFAIARDGAAGVPRTRPASGTCNGSANAPASSYFVSAEPEEPGNTGTMYFATDARGIIYRSDRPIANPIRASASVVPMQ